MLGCGVDKWSVSLPVSRLAGTVHSSILNRKLRGNLKMNETPWRKMERTSPKNQKISKSLMAFQLQFCFFTVGGGEGVCSGAKLVANRSEHLNLGGEFKFEKGAGNISPPP
jgi:hypothetical protein